MQGEFGAFRKYLSKMEMRREGDSNPRSQFTRDADLANRCIRPLCHLSEVFNRNDSRFFCNSMLVDAASCRVGQCHGIFPLPDGCYRDAARDTIGRWKNDTRFTSFAV